MSDTNEIELTEQHKARFQTLLNRSAELLCEERVFGDHFIYSPLKASNILRLQLIYKKGNELELLFLFPRRSQFKPLYKEIRSWFESQNLAWKDRQVEGKRYMGAVIPRDETEIVRLVNDFLKAHWNYEILQISSQRVSLSYKLTKLSMSGTMICMVGIFASLIILIVHQITKLGKITSPLITNISKFEWLFIITLMASGITMAQLLRKQISQRYSSREKVEVRKIWQWRIGILICVFLIPASTGL